MTRLAFFHVVQAGVVLFATREQSMTETEIAFVGNALRTRFLPEDGFAVTEFTASGGYLMREL